MGLWDDITSWIDPTVDWVAEALDYEDTVDIGAGLTTAGDYLKQDVKDFLNEFLKMITKFKADGVKYYGLWQLNLTTVLPPTYIKIITDFMPQIREVGAEVNLGSAIVFKSGTIRSLLDNYIVK